VAEGGGALHLIGLVSEGGIHSHQGHAEEVVRIAAARGVRRVYVHALLDGRDTLPQEAGRFIERLERELRKTGLGKIATVAGRFYGMDRDGNWARTESAWRALVLGEGERAPSAEEAVRRAYARGEDDEFVLPTAIAPQGQEPPEGRIASGDSLLFFNFRADRMRQIVRAFAEEGFEEFPTPGRPELARAASMTQYHSSFTIPVLFPPQAPGRVLGEVIADAGIPQVRIAETEKYAHVTYFLNGGREEVFPGEERALIPSKKMKSYAALPEMQAEEITRAALKALEDDSQRLVVVNYANPDMVGHSGDFDAATRACRFVDRCVAKLVKAYLEKGGAVLITSDHGNAEMMLDPTSGSAHTAHTTNPVPCILVVEDLRGLSVPREGMLTDIAPTILKLIGLEIPEGMTGRSLV
jgi:2,3-bisphosphoglycerate-independent phosphoglycerate mutase